MLYLRRTRIVVRRRWLPWLALRPAVLGLKPRPFNLLLDGEALRLNGRALAPYDEVLLLERPGRQPLKALLPFSWSLWLAGRAPRRLVSQDNYASYRYLRLDEAHLLAVASEQMVLVEQAAMSLRHALELAAGHLAPEQPRPQPA